MHLLLAGDDITIIALWLLDLHHQKYLRTLRNADHAAVTAFNPIRNRSKE